MKGRTALQVRRYGRYFLILLGLMIVGSAAAIYILRKQRLPNPFQTFYSVNAEFPSAAAVAPGLGEPVNVAGVKVGTISGTSLRSGLGIVHMKIDPKKLPRIYRNAHASLVPNTPLMDMQVNIWPGSPATGVLAHGATIPVGRTLSPINNDELLSALDADTRTWFTSLVTALAEGTAGRGQDIRALLRNLGPTSEQLRQVGDLLAARRHELASLVHNLGVLNKAASAKDAQIAQVVKAGNTTVGALASQDVALQASIDRLPSVLATTRATLVDTAAFANALSPTANALVPIARRLPQTLRDTNTLVQGALLLPLDQIKPFVDAVTPLTTQLPPLESALRQASPLLINSFKVLAYVTNEVAYRPGGKNPGFLYWIAWFAHNANSFIGSSDANGPAWRSLILATCPSLKAFAFGPLIETLLGTNFGCT
jgi:phospholipid/cholesterol/gamma-HCH transport system substrate-binding protein